MHFVCRFVPARWDSKGASKCQLATTVSIWLAYPRHNSSSHVIQINSTQVLVPATLTLRQNLCLQMGSASSQRHLVGGGNYYGLSPSHKLSKFFQTRFYSWKHPLRIDWAPEARSETNQQALPSVYIMMWLIASRNSQTLWTPIKLGVMKIKWVTIVQLHGLFSNPNYSEVVEDMFD